MWGRGRPQNRESHAASPVLNRAVAIRRLTTQPPLVHQFLACVTSHKSSKAYFAVSSRPGNRCGSICFHTWSRSPENSVMSLLASAISTSSRHAHSFIASNCSVAGTRTTIPVEANTCCPTLAPTTKPFAASLSQSSGHDISVATAAAQPLTSAESVGETITTSRSLVDRRASKRRTIAPPPTRSRSAISPSAAASSPRRRSAPKASSFVIVAILTEIDSTKMLIPPQLCK